MSNLAMAVTGLPSGVRLAQLRREHVGELTELVHAKEQHYFGRSETNTQEILGTLSAPELGGPRGTAGLWEGDRLVAALLAFNGLQHERGLYLDLFIGESASDRELLAARLIEAGERYGATLSAPSGAQVKVESFAGDEQTEAVLAERDYERHRVYLRMRIDFTGPVPTPRPPGGLQVRQMHDDRWPEVHDVVTQSFQDHYDSHPLPLDMFRQANINETTDFGRWSLVYDANTCIGVCIASRRFEPAGLGYVETLGVLREYRGRGIGRFLLLDSFARDAAAGMSGSSLHCDATNPTGATALYQSVGMHPDHEYIAWRRPLNTGGRFATGSGH